MEAMLEVMVVDQVVMETMLDLETSAVVAEVMVVCNNNLFMTIIIIFISLFILMSI